MSKPIMELKTLIASTNHISVVFIWKVKTKCFMTAALVIHNIFRLLAIGLKKKEVDASFVIKNQLENHF